MTGKKPAPGGRADPSERKVGIPAFRPMKPREYGATKTVVAAAVDQAGGAKAAAAFLERSLSVVYGYTDPLVDHADLTLDQARRLAEYRGVTVFAEDFAALAGGAFVPGAGTGAGVMDDAAATTEDSGRFVSDLLRAVADGVVTPAERDALLPRIDRLIADAVILRNALRAMK